MQKKLNISEETHRKVNLICFLRNKRMGDFLAGLVDDYLTKNPLPKGLKISKEYSLEEV